MPSRALTSGRKFSTTTSAFSTSRRNTSRPFWSFRLSVMARLLRCRFWKSEPWRGPPGCSPAASSIRASILTTLAPQSASCRTQVGPERTRVRSSTVKRDRADEACGEGIYGLRSFVGFQDLAVLARRYRCDLVWFNTLFPRNRQNDKPTEGALLNDRNTFRIILEARRQVGLVLVIQFAIASSVADRRVPFQHSC